MNDCLCYFVYSPILMSKPIRPNWIVKIDIRKFHHFPHIHLSCLVRYLSFVCTSALTFSIQEICLRNEWALFKQEWILLLVFGRSRDAIILNDVFMEGEMVVSTIFWWRFWWAKASFTKVFLVLSRVNIFWFKRIWIWREMIPSDITLKCIMLDLWHGLFLVFFLYFLKDSVHSNVL